MGPIAEQLKRPEILQLSAQLLVLYVASVAIFFGVYWINAKAILPLQEAVAKGSKAARLAVFLIAAASNVVGVATLVFLSRKVGTVPRLAMVGLNLFLIVEAYVRRWRAEPKAKPLNVVAACGAAAGMIGAAFVLMRDCPLK